MIGCAVSIGEAHMAPGPWQCGGRRVAARFYRRGLQTLGSPGRSRRRGALTPSEAIDKGVNVSPARRNAEHGHGQGMHGHRRRHHCHQVSNIRYHTLIIGASSGSSQSIAFGWTAVSVPGAPHGEPPGWRNVVYASLVLDLNLGVLLCLDAQRGCISYRHRFLRPHQILGSSDDSFSAWPVDSSERCGTLGPLATYDRPSVRPLWRTRPIA